MHSILTSLASPLPGSFEFTPEGYAKASRWIPEDGFIEDDFFSQDFSSLSKMEYDAKRAEFLIQNKDKLEIIEHPYWDRSMRTLLPERWLMAYTRDKAWQEVNGKKIALYSQLKQTLVFKSFVLGYGEGAIHKLLPNREVATYIKEHCASSARLKAISLRAYESVANMGGYSTWTTVSPPVFLCLAAAKSSLDSVAAILWTLLFHEIPKKPNRKTKVLEPFFPSIAEFRNKLREKNHSFQNQFEKLYQSSWYRNLQDARDKVIHRAASPVVHDKFGAAFDFDLGMFTERSANKGRTGRARVGMEKNMKCIHLDKIMKSFVAGLERWEASVARKLQKLAWFRSLNNDGVLMGIEFSDDNLLRDGWGPWFMIKSRTQKPESASGFFRHHSFKRGTTTKSSVPS